MKEYTEIHARYYRKIKKEYTEIHSKIAEKIDIEIHSIER